MPVIHTPESEYAKELKKWDEPKRLGGMNADGYVAFPRMIYRALPHEKRGGKVMCGDPLVATGDSDAESFARQCQATVNSQDELDRYLANGWSLSPDGAVEAYEQAQRRIADAAAEEAYRVRRMSENAQAEFQQAQDDADGTEHVPDPAAPKKGPKGKRIVPATE